jgi:hypothetical protein
LKIIEIKNIKVLANIIKGPDANPVNSENKIPEQEDTMPIIIAPKAY